MYTCKGKKANGSNCERKTHGKSEYCKLHINRLKKENAINEGASICEHKSAQIQKLCTNIVYENNLCKRHYDLWEKNENKKKWEEYNSQPKLSEDEIMELYVNDPSHNEEDRIRLRENMNKISKRKEEKEIYNDGDDDYS